MSYLLSLTKRTVATFYDVAKIMLPVMIIVRVLETFGLSGWLGNLLAPLMGLLGLPGEAGLVWAIALLTGLYGGIGALIALMGALDLTVGQFNALVCMILFAHGLPLEQAIVKRAGGGILWPTFARVFCAVMFALLIYWITLATGWYSETATLGVIPTTKSGSGWDAWLVSTLTTFAIMLVILFVLLALIDGMKKSGLFSWLTVRMTPFFARLGIIPALAPLTTLGALLGLTYGGGLLIAEVNERKQSAAPNFTTRELLPPLVGLSIIHALIEDSIVMLAFGADFWIAIVARTLFALLVLAVFAKLLALRDVKTVAPQSQSH